MWIWNSFWIIFGIICGIFLDQKPGCRSSFLPKTHLFWTLTTLGPFPIDSPWKTTYIDKFSSQSDQFCPFSEFFTLFPPIYLGGALWDLARPMLHTRELLNDKVWAWKTRIWPIFINIFFGKKNLLLAQQYLLRAQQYLLLEQQFLFLKQQSRGSGTPHVTTCRASYRAS